MKRRKIENAVGRSIARPTAVSVTSPVTAVGASGGSAFDPSQLDGLELWLDAADTNTVLHATDPVVASDGETVRQWLDKSGNDRHANQATGISQPLLDSDGLGSKPALVFDGSNDFFESGSIGDWNFLHDGSDALIVAVVRFGLVSNPSAAYTLVGTGGATQSGTGVWLAYDDRPAYGGDAARLVIPTGVNNQLVVNYPDSGKILPLQDYIFETAIDADNTTTSQRVKFVANGDAPSGANAADFSPQTGDSNYAMNIGRSAVSGGVVHSVMSLSELIVCSNHNATKRSDLRNYLATKWGVTLA